MDVEVFGREVELIGEVAWVRAWMAANRGPSKQLGLERVSANAAAQPTKPSRRSDAEAKKSGAARRAASGER